jgi:hypothetical protein
MSAYGGKADSRWTFPECLLLTQTGHWPSNFAVMHNTAFPAGMR